MISPTSQSKMLHRPFRVEVGQNLVEYSRNTGYNVKKVLRQKRRPEIMNIHTELVENKQYNCSIRSALCKHSQEYRVLATLRYLFPGEYEAMVVEDSPDLQDCKNGVGIEVTIATRQNDMKATDALTKFRQANDKKEAEKYKEKIESSGYSVIPILDRKISISTTGTADGEKRVFQNSIWKKIKKLSAYRTAFKNVGIAIILWDSPTSEAEGYLVDWIREVFQEYDRAFDFAYVISHRFCIYYEVQKKCSNVYKISAEESRLLRIIARMTAEGELSLQSQEWK